jgi:hypothetical protein
LVKITIAFFFIHESVGQLGHFYLKLASWLVGLALGWIWVCSMPSYSSLMKQLLYSSHNQWQVFKKRTNSGDGS